MVLAGEQELFGVRLRGGIHNVSVEVMKVNDTLQSDLIYSTLRERLREFVAVTPYLYTNAIEATHIVKNYFPSWQYNGNGQFEEVMQWCQEHFGRDWIWNFETIYFKNEQDRLVCALRWS